MRQRNAGLVVVFAFAMVLAAGTAAAQSWPDLGTPAPGVGGGSRDAALVISIERYGNLPPIPGAESNGRAWYLHLTKARKVPVDRVKWLNNADAAKENIEDAADKVATWVKPGGTLWLVFIGHGAPASDGRDGVLVGQDAQQTARMLYARSVPQSALLKRLGAGRQAQTVVVVDACFSGRSGGGSALAPGLMPTLAAKRPRLDRRTTLLSAGTSQQFAGPLPGAARPAFSYLVLGALRGWGDADANGRVTAAEAVTYAGGVLRTLVNGRTQTPQVQGSGGLALSRVGPRGEKGPDLAALRTASEPALRETGMRPSGPKLDTLASTSRTPYPAATRKAFLDACERSTPRQVCECMLRRIEGRYPFAKFLKSYTTPEYKAFTGEIAKACTGGGGEKTSRRSFPAAPRKVFLDVCGRSTAMAVCACMLRKLEGKYTFERFKELEAKMIKGEDDSGFKAYIGKIAGPCTANPQTP